MLALISGRLGEVVCIACEFRSHQRGWSACKTEGRGGADLDVLVFLLKSLGLYPFLWVFKRICYLYKILFMNNGPLKGKFSNFSSFCISNYLTPLLLIPQTKSLPVGIEFMRSLVFDGIWIYSVDFYFYGRVDVDLVNSGGERYWQNFC